MIIQRVMKIFGRKSKRDHEQKDELRHEYLGRSDIDDEANQYRKRLDVFHFASVAAAAMHGSYRKESDALDRHNQYR